MEIFFALLVLGLVAVGVRTVTNATTTRYRAMLSSWREAVEQEKARRASGQPGRPTRWLSGVVFGLGMWAAAGREGWRIGREYGRLRDSILARAEQQYEPVPVPEPRSPQPPPVAGPPPTAPVDDEPTELTEEPPMAPTTTHVEITNLDTAIIEYEHIRDEAVAELEEARAAAARAEEDLARVEKNANAIAVLDFPAEVKANAASLLESNRALHRAAQEKITFAEQRIAQTNAVLASLYRHRAIQDAADAAGGMAHKQAYVRS